MLKPLQQWICDFCGELIDSPEQGYVEWIPGENGKRVSFKIVHHAPASPNYPEENCYHDRHQYKSSLSLDTFTGENGLVYLQSFLDIGPYHDDDYKGPWVGDIREFVEFMRRLTIPYYEEARLYWDSALSDGFFEGANEVWVYLPETLKTLIETYSEQT